MSGRVYVNNFSTTLNGSITNVATSVVITSATGLPTLSGSEYYNLTITDGSSIEIVKVTARTTTTLTVVRGQEGTSGTAFASGSTIRLDATAASLVDWTDATANISTTGTIQGGNLKLNTNTLSSQDTNGNLNLVPNGSGFLVVGGGAAETTMKFMEASGNGTNFVAIKAAASLSGNTTYTLPTADGTSGYVLSTNGSGTLSWISAGGGGGGVTGPGSSTANGIALFSGTGGSTLKDSATTDGLINSLTVGLGASSIATNTAVGATALAAVTSGSNSTGVGYLALNALTSGSNNIAFGANAGKSITTGHDTVSLGKDALSTATTGHYSVAIGSSAMASATATSCVAIGYQALQTASSGSYSVVIGYQAGASAAIGTESVLVGYTSGQYSTGSGNVCVGSSTGSYTTFSGSNNVFMGYQTAAGAITSAGHNVGIGAFAYSGLTSGTENVAIGKNSLISLTTSNYNVAIGSGTGGAGASGSAAITTGASNTFLGYQASGSNASTNGVIAMGRDAVAVKATGTSSSDDGPGIAIGSGTFPVGFRGDASIYPSSGASAGYWQVKINGTAYKIQLYAV